MEELYFEDWKCAVDNWAMLQDSISYTEELIERAKLYETSHEESLEILYFEDWMRAVDNWAMLKDSIYYTEELIERDILYKDWYEHWGQFEDLDEDSYNQKEGRDNYYDDSLSNENFFGSMDEDTRKAWNV